MTNNTNNIANQSNVDIDVKTGALILIDILFSKNLINKETYKNIQEKYNFKYKQTKTVER